MKLTWIQRYYGASRLAPPCEYIDRCGNRAIGLWQDEDGHAHDLCQSHAEAQSAPPMEEGICYAPTHS